MKKELVIKNIEDFKKAEPNIIYKVKENTVLADDIYDFIDSFCNEWFQLYCGMLMEFTGENDEFVLIEGTSFKVENEDNYSMIILEDWNEDYPVYLFNCGVLRDKFNLVLEYED